MMFLLLLTISAAQANPLGVPMDYLIGADGCPSGKPGRAVTSPYDCPKPRNGVGIAYGNLFDEKNQGKYAPYRHQSGTAKEYNEGEIIPGTKGWYRNLRDQFSKRKNENFEYIELDNPDAYSIGYVLEAVDIAKEYNLRVIAKNPGITESPRAYVSNENIYGITVEDGAGNPHEMNELRKHSRKKLSVWFVFFGRTMNKAREYARIIRQTKYKDMFVTYSDKGEYKTSRDIK